jgi:hypothetical protein
MMNVLCTLTKLQQQSNATNAMDFMHLSADFGDANLWTRLFDMVGRFHPHLNQDKSGKVTMEATSKEWGEIDTPTTTMVTTAMEVLTTTEIAITEMETITVIVMEMATTETEMVFKEETIVATITQEETEMVLGEVVTTEMEITEIIATTVILVSQCLTSAEELAWRLTTVHQDLRLVKVKESWEILGSKHHQPMFSWTRLMFKLHPATDIFREGTAKKKKKAKK